MSAVVAGLIGTALGLGLKWLADIATDRLRQSREDRVWRRDRYVEAAADLLGLSTELVGANERIVYAIHSLGNAEGRTDKGAAAAVEHYQKRLNTLYEEHVPLLAPANRAVQILRLYAPDEVAQVAAALRDLSHQSPEPGEVRAHWETVKALQSELVDLVRASA